MARLAFLVALLLGAASGAAQPAAEVPVERVILFTSGVGYFEHGGRVAGDADVTLRFDTEALNDVLKSLVVEDRGGRVAGVVYPTQAPVERTLRAFAVDLSGSPDLANVLRQVRGAEVAVTTPDGTVRGTVVAVSRQTRESGGAAVEVDVLSLLTDGGLVAVRLDTARQIAFADPALQAELEGALSALAEARGGDRKPVRVQFRGRGSREVRMGYVIASPVWKTSYRLVLPEAGDDGTLQGWALVENPTEADWTDVDLTLVSGRPVSFVIDLYTPRFVDRPVVALPDDAVVRPESYEAGVGRLGGGSSASVRSGGPAGTLTGTVRDATTGEDLIGANVFLEGTGQGASTDVDGRFEIRGLRPGSYTARVGYVGYVAYTQTVRLGGGNGIVMDVRLGSQELSEVTVEYEAPQVQNDALGAAVVTRGGRASAEPQYFVDGVRIDPTSSVSAQGTSGDFGELFAYRLGAVTLPRRGSAMIPIVSGDVEVERLSVYTGAAGRHPMRGVRLENTTGASLRGGPMTVLDDGYAGDALLPDLPPGDERLLTFAVDQDVLVDPYDVPDAPGVVETARLVDGYLSLERQRRTTRAYRLENRGDRRRVVLVQHPRTGDARLLAPTEAEESTPEAYRFRVPLAPGAIDSLEVVEVRTLGERIGLTSLSADQILAYARADGRIPDDVRDALRRAADRRRDLAETERRYNDLRRELSEIEQEQNRLRGNLEAVDNDTDYGRRLLAKLNDQETRIEAIRVELEEVEAQVNQQREALRVTVR